MFIDSSATLVQIKGACVLCTLEPSEIILIFTQFVLKIIKGVLENMQSRKRQAEQSVSLASLARPLPIICNALQRTSIFAGTLHSLHTSADSQSCILVGLSTHLRPQSSLERHHTI